LKPERWQQVEKIFNEALEQNPNDRAVFLDNACGEDAWLRQKVETLIRSDEAAGSFLESSAFAAGASESSNAPHSFIGRSLGPYEIKMHVGSGGMGDVYRARDTKLRRDVAIKILPPEFSRDPERVARFQREAVALAALNHPNIAAIHDLEDIDGSLFLVLEFVEGETLAALLQKTKLPVERALRLCKQVAEGLEAAHIKGVHHRDLKPENIQVTQDDRVKLLDFGLAKMLDLEGDLKNSSPAPNITRWNTQPGMILGTVAYLSPEQARGRQPDKRSDIWAFGCVMFEAITGKQAFDGETITDVLASVLKSEPDWGLLPTDLAPSAVFLLRRCLQKEPKQRLHEIADARLALEDAIASGSFSPQPVPAKADSRWLRIATVAILAAAVAAFVTWNFRPVPPESGRSPSSTPPTAALIAKDSTAVKSSQTVQAADSPASEAPSIASNQVARQPQPLSPRPTRSSALHFSWTLPPGQRIFRTLQRVIAISPDGETMAYGSNDELYLHPTSRTEAYRISGTASALTPTFSPDGQWLAFWMRSDRTLKKMRTDGGGMVTLTPASVLPSGLDWQGDTIVYAAPNGIVAIPASGGGAELWVKPEPGEIVDSPQMLDGGNSVLFSVTRDMGMDRWDRADVVLFNRKTGQRKVLIHNGSDARYLASGYIVYVLGNTLLGVRYNPTRQEIIGKPVPVIDDLLHTVREVPFYQFGAAQFGFSSAANGTLIYIPKDAQPGKANQASYREIRRVVNWLDDLKRQTPES